LPLFAEVSVFGAGDLNSPNPYGLTSAEKVIIKNKQILTKNQKKINRVDSSIKELFERVEGLESVVDGESVRVNKLSKKFNKHLENFKLQSDNLDLKITQNKQSIQNNSNILKSFATKLELLQSDIDTNKQNILNLKSSLDKAVQLLNNISNNYVSRKEFNTLLDIIDKKSKKVAKKNSKSKDSFDGKSKKNLIEKARYYFKKDYFTKALPILEYLIKYNYRPAECNFLVGEIKYYRKKYADALHFFKTSMLLYDKARYLPKLLLHSAVCFEKSGDKAQAKTFYSTLIDIYPDTNEAKQASKKIKKLN
jgi:TolA-binding protein